MRFLVGLLALFPFIAAAQSWPPPASEDAGVPPVDTSSTPIVVVQPPRTTYLLGNTVGPGGQGIAQTFSAPELDAASLASALTLIGGGLLVIRGRRRPY